MDQTVGVVGLGTMGAALAANPGGRRVHGARPRRQGSTGHPGGWYAGAPDGIGSVVTATWRRFADAEPDVDFTRIFPHLEGA